MGEGGGGGGTGGRRGRGGEEEEQEEGSGEGDEGEEGRDPSIKPGSRSLSRHSRDFRSQFSGCWRGTFRDGVALPPLPFRHSGRRDGTPPHPRQNRLAIAQKGRISDGARGVLSPPGGGEEAALELWRNGRCAK